MTGSVANGVTFRHADGSDYGKSPDPRRVEARAQAFAALQKLGFREAETRRALTEAFENLREQPPSLERFLREALARLIANGGQRAFRKAC